MYKKIKNKNNFISEKYNLLLDEIDEVIWEFNLNTKSSNISSSVKKMLNADKFDTITLEDWMERMKLADKNKLLKILENNDNYLKEDYNSNVEYTFNIKTLDNIEKTILAKFIFIKEGNDKIILSINKEIVPYFNKNNGFQNDESYKGLINNPKDISYKWDVKEDKLYINDNIKNIFLNKAKLNFNTYYKWLDVIHDDDKIRAQKTLIETLKNKKSESYSCEYRVKCLQNQIKWLASKGKIKRNDKGEALFISGYLVDITDTKEKEIKIEYMNCFDNITGAYSRHYFKKYLKEYIEDYSKLNSKKQSVLIFIDLDNFKSINDNYGYEFGDKVLRQVALELTEKLKSSSNTVARFGGDEFVIFIENIEKYDSIDDIAEELLEIFKTPKNIAGKKVYVTSSMGATRFPQDATDYEMLLKRTDLSMYRAKNSGKNRCQIFKQEILTEIDRTYKLDKGLRLALENDELFLNLQPKVCIFNNKIIGFEALLRWNNSELGLISPGEFIPIAEKTGIIIPIGKFVIEEVFKQCKELIAKGFENFKIALNLSEVQLRDGKIVEVFEDLFKKYNIPPKYIEVEITESMLMKSFDKNIKTLMNLKNSGITIALDDFGTGYSSLNYLTRLPIDILKIDQSFINEIDKNHKSRFVIENIINLSHGLGIKVVAEGVEHSKQVEYLRGISCDFVQGYYYSKPESFDKALQLMKQSYFN